VGVAARGPERRTGTASRGGNVAAIEIAPALAVPGVVRVLTHRDLPRLASAPTPPLASSFMPMQSDEVRHEGQPVGFLV
jgi:xanthine dehydrogenase YagR molybdenum-binding subunit